MPLKTIDLNFKRMPPKMMKERAHSFLDTIASRRSVRDFSSEPIPLDVVRTAITCAAQAPSGANKQPWTFVLVTDPAVKQAIRRAAEREETAFYDGRASEEWLDDLAPLGTNEHKPFLEKAPALIVVFAQSSGSRGAKHYYVKESVGIACGFLLASLHMAGLATLTHTPSPMNFLAEVLERPANERAFLLIPVGYPQATCKVPDIFRKPRVDFLVER
jgi:iodotyrosine deiodinase